MLTRKAYLICAAALLAACSAQQDGNESNSVVNSAETHNAAAAPLSNDQALALMKERHEHMEAFGDATKKASNALKSTSPDMDAIRDSATRIQALAPRLLSWFPQGTGPEVGKTRAKAEIWQKAEDFALKAHDFERAAKEFDVAAKRGDIGEVKTTFAALGKSCKACHDLYRAPKKD